MTDPRNNNNNNNKLKNIQQICKNTAAKHTIKEPQKRAILTTAHTHTAESADVIVQTIQHRK